MLATAASLALVGAEAPTFAQMQMREQTVTVGGSPMYPFQEHYPECSQLQGPHHARRGGEGCRLGRDAARTWSLHGLRADQRRLREATVRHSRFASQV